MIVPRDLPIIRLIALRCSQEVGRYENRKYGTVAVLEGTGLLQGDLSLTVDGQPVASYAVHTVREQVDEQDLNSFLRDRQIVTFNVPAGATSGVIKVVTSGGTAMLRSGVAAISGPPLIPTARLETYC